MMDHAWPEVISPSEVAHKDSPSAEASHPSRPPEKLSVTQASSAPAKIGGQCLSDRRIGELPELQTEIGTWSDKTNAKQRGVDWQFRIEDARMKLKRLYPKIKA